MSEMNAGSRMRLKGDPGRIGVLTGKVRDREGLRYWQIQFPDMPQYVPEDQLDNLPESGKDLIH